MAKAAKLSDTEKLATLEHLADDAGARLDYALMLLVAEREHEVVAAALEVVAGGDDPRLRPALLARYGQLGESPSRLDSGASLRAALLRALGPLALPEDRPLLERAAMTYESLPPFTSPMRGDLAGALRAAALDALDRSDREAAGYHAARLLADSRTSEMSGEPALTAARVLAGQGQTLPLYAYAARESGTGTLPEVVGECLRYLVDLPPTLLAELVARFRDSREEVILLGLLDLLLAHPERAEYHGFLQEFLRETRTLNVYRYLVLAIRAGRDELLITLLRAHRHAERDPRKVQVLEEALGV